MKDAPAIPGAGTDLVVIGAGPAGLAAAATAAEAGLSVLLLDEAEAPGGQVWRNAPALLARPGARRPLLAGFHGAEAALARFAASGARHRGRATLTDLAVDPEGVTLTWLDRTGDRTGDRPRLRHLAARGLVLATGAQERPMPFPGAQLPGVMGVGALQTAMKGSGLVPAAPGVVLAGQGPLLLLVLAQLRAMGGQVAAVLDMTPPGWAGRALPHLPAALTGDPRLVLRGAGLVLRRALAGWLGQVPVHRGVAGLRAEGEGRFEAVSFTAGGRRHRIPAGLLAVHDGVIPNAQVARFLGLEHRWSSGQGAFLPQVDADGAVAPQAGAPAVPVWLAGDGAGIAGAEAAALAGALAGHAAVARLVGQTRPAELPALRRRLARRRAARALLEALHPPLPLPEGDAAADTLLCRCEAVSLAAAATAVAEGATGPNRVKAFTRCGMGPCQGRMCANPLTRLIARETGAAPDAVGALRIRAPLKPVLLGDYLDDEAADAAAVPADG